MGRRGLSWRQVLARGADATWVQQCCLPLSGCLGSTQECPLKYPLEHVEVPTSASLAAQTPPASGAVQVLLALNRCQVRGRGTLDHPAAGTGAGTGAGRDGYRRSPPSFPISGY
ncbi:hypothetical protein V8C26DRAFT_212372 [Trichoderma gracile]